ncbi:MAG: hypothetical protein DRO13_01920 [Thermoprotei archaeon]|nr:MAG: hypothetical protein DRO13_01920 [Thermoprotei archaeon]
MTLNMALSLLVDNDLVEEVVVLRRNGEIFCYPCGLEPSTIEKYNQLLESARAIFEHKEREVYMSFHDMSTGDIVVAFKLPSNDNMFVKVRYMELASLVRSHILDIIERLREMTIAQRNQ